MHNGIQHGLHIGSKICRSGHAEMATPTHAGPVGVAPGDKNGFRRKSKSTATKGNMDVAELVDQYLQPEKGRKQDSHPLGVRKGG